MCASLMKAMLWKNGERNFFLSENIMSFVIKHVQSIPEKFYEIPCIYHIDWNRQPRIQIFPKESE